MQISKKLSENKRPIGLKIAGWSVLFVAFISPWVLSSQGGIGFSPILTGSMRPAAYPGDVFVTKSTKTTLLKVGDIIAVHNQVTGTFYAHRIFEIKKVNGIFRILTKGDANQSVDTDQYLVSTKGIVAKEIFRVLWVGRPLVYLSSYRGRQATLALVVTANVLGLIYFLFRKKDNPRSVSEQVYKELYQEESLTSERYLGLLNEANKNRNDKKKPIQT